MGIRGGKEMIFQDRTDAGRQLATQLASYSRHPNLLVLALPRGGVPVAFEVARALRAPLDVFLVRKLGVPGHEELAMGAVATGGIRVLNEDVVNSLRIPPEAIDRAVSAEQRELDRREREYRDARPAPAVRDHTVILVDDGLATGSTMRAAIKALQQQGPEALVVGVPVASPDVCEQFRSEVSDIVCVATPEPFYAVGYWYQDFAQTTDEEVRDLLSKAEQHQSVS